jgi:hypothetical protein
MALFEWSSFRGEMELNRGGSLEYYLEGVRVPLRCLDSGAALSVAHVRSREVGNLRYHLRDLRELTKDRNSNVALSGVLDSPNLLV